MNDFLRAITCQIAPNTVISEKMHPTAKLVVAKPKKSAFLAKPKKISLFAQSRPVLLRFYVSPVKLAVCQ